ncbi:meiotic sister-chromatid recombination aldehyde dehydrogenase [Dichomitus squalens]|uniref:meiotic sister-chromatid recombination aldehyde dehydrogenase n=1 Tax=Dichomitus squalens (strain LYAD-421) TaxID=732165 RepID=UPI0004412946|nr:meiotic sister-chromatid recombination aldehyde dehydrogenase [Dichomitus squalens LYAD-421 SS1]EJF67146.1 meiotic sister-chromatid recombination aldehyde dehydrogenase [Dichomitus squalens LYAD-421 SS1]TBU49992.1 meiotic sister-chromatid recombination aldehyde dehydrogenase [Dichomitus squalens]
MTHYHEVDYDYDDEGGLIDPAWLLAICFGLGIWLVINRYQSLLNRAIFFRIPPPPQIKETWTAQKLPEPGLEAHLNTDGLLPAIPLEGRKYITAYDPATAYHLDTVLADTPTEITKKIADAYEAQKEWANTSFHDRRRVMRSLKKWLVDNQETCAKVACRDTGKTMLDAALGEIITTCSKLDWLINHGERALAPQKRYNNLIMFYKSSYVHYEPLGVVSAIVSWNYPLHNAWSPIIAALFAGNSIVLKCSEHVIWSTTWFVKAIQECLKACGHDEQLVQLVCCYPEDAEALTKSPFIRHITFIGSERVGRIVAQAATEYLTPVTLELGGKDPAIILPSTDLEKHLPLLMRGVYQNAGQNCIGIERILVHESQYEDLFILFTERADKLRPGHSLKSPGDGVAPVADVGAMISGERFPGLQHAIQEAVDQGATLTVGGEPWLHPYLERGSYFKPTVLGDVNPDAPIAQSELFAPIGLIIKYETVEQAIEIANGTRYGLGASVFGPVKDECLKVAKRLQCGMVAINDFGVFYLNQDLPFGGTKYSGYGRFGGPEGLRALTNTKAIVYDRWGWAIQTTIPAVLDYPVRSVTQSWDFISGLVAFLYADGWRQRIDALTKLIRASGR